MAAAAAGSESDSDSELVLAVRFKFGVNWSSLLWEWAETWSWRA